MGARALNCRTDPTRGGMRSIVIAAQQLPREPSALLQLLQRFQVSFGTHALVVSHHRASSTRKRRQKCHPFMKASPIYRSVIHLRKSKSKRKLEPPLSKVAWGVTNSLSENHNNPAIVAFDFGRCGVTRRDCPLGAARG